MEQVAYWNCENQRIEMYPHTNQEDKMDKRYDYIPFKDGKMVDLGGYYEGRQVDAVSQAHILSMYGYDQVSIECEGVIVDVVKFQKAPVYRHFCK